MFVSGDLSLGHDGFPLKTPISSCAHPPELANWLTADAKCRMARALQVSFAMIEFARCAMIVNPISDPTDRPAKGVLHPSCRKKLEPLIHRRSSPCTSGSNEHNPLWRALFESCAISNCLQAETNLMHQKNNSARLTYECAKCNVRRHTEHCA